MSHRFPTIALLSLAIAAPATAAPPPPQQFTALSANPVARSSATPPRELRVLLGHYRRLNLTGQDLIVPGLDSFPGPAALSVRCGLEDQAPFVELGGRRENTDRVDVLAPRGLLQVNGKPYHNRITIYQRGDECAVVNTVDLEKYLAGLLNREMSPSWPMEALKAQAVASRSYALFQMEANRGRAFDVESTTQDQVYDGAESETPKSRLAVEQTRGLVLSFAESPVKAYFHANCGGMTELPAAVWGGDSPAFRPVACPYHKRPRDRQRWSLHLSPQQIQQALQKVGGALPQGFRRLASLEAGAPNPRQRLHDVLVADTNGNNLVVSANVFRNAIGNTKVKSTAFHVHKEKGGYRIQGEGFGHGVGMCQVGARAMAEQGRGFRQILSYYYPLAKLRTF